MIWSLLERLEAHDPATMHSSSNTAARQAITTSWRWGAGDRRTSSTSLVDPGGAVRTSQIKRIHEYKRQLLNIIEAVALYPRDQGNEPPKGTGYRGSRYSPARAAASYRYAKR